MVRRPVLPVLPVSGPWNRLHRLEADPLAALLAPEERAAVSRRLGHLFPATWVPPSAGPAGSRYAPPLGPGALYLAADVETCAAEVAHHHARACAASRGTPPGTRAVFRQLAFQVEGIMGDAAALGPEDPDDYGPSWGFGTRAREGGLDGILYRSARRTGGRCLAVFNEGAVTFLRAETGAVVLEWDGDQSRRLA